MDRSDEYQVQCPPAHLTRIAHASSVLLTCTHASPVRPDVPQLVAFILKFKAFQFLSFGLYPALVLGMGARSRHVTYLGWRAATAFSARC